MEINATITNEALEEYASLKELNGEILQALKYAYAELDAVYGTISKHYTISLGRFGRLESMREIIAKAKSCAS